MNHKILPLLILVAGCSGAPSQNGADEEQGLFVIHPFNLQIDSISPSTPVENRPITINFHQSNRFLRAPRSGWVAVQLLPAGSPPVEDAGSQWKIVSLGSGQVAHGVVTVTAPPASNGNFVKLFYFETWNAGEFPTPGPHLAESAAQPFDVAGRYSVDINWMRIGSTRQLAQADYLSAGLAIDSPISVSTGSVELGSYDTGLHPIWLAPPARVDLVPFVSNALQYNYTFSDFVNGNWYCHGIVAQDTLSFSAADIATLTAGNGVHEEGRRYRFSSPAGCNTGDYIINSQVVRHSGNDDVPFIVPSTVQLAAGGRVQFSAANFQGPVSWSVSGGALNGVIDGNGLYTATQPLDPHAVVTIVAVDNQQHSATAALGLAQ